MEQQSTQSTPLRLSTGIATLAIHALASQTTGPSEFDWTSITPSHNLEYHPCYHDRQCARLLLPLDWLDESNDETVAIAITKLPAVVDEDNDSFGGAIFAQPGGPAVSGTRFNVARAQFLRDNIDISGKKHYEIVSFDGRGIGRSEPHIDCFPGLLGYMRGLETEVNGALDISPAALAFRIAAADADGRQCEKTHGKFLSHVGTPNVARDMVAMIDKIEHLRRDAAKRRQQSDYGEYDDTTTLELRRDVHEEDVPRLQYIGVSYGTFIGNTFASMFPGRVGRMVLDGVMGADDVVNGLGWLKSLSNTDEMADMFFQGCFAAGQKICPLRREQDASADDIRGRFWSWTDGLNEGPLIATTKDNVRHFIRAGDVRNVFLSAMYYADYQFQPLAMAFSDAMQGNGTGLLERVLDWNEYEPLQGEAGKYLPSPLIARDPQSAIICADGDDVSGENNSVWQSYLRKQLALSSVAGAFWATLRLNCAGWPARPNWRFKGPFTSPKPSNSSKSPETGHPAAPLLFISTRYDPVTPALNARAMAGGHPGAAVMIQESMGHCVTLAPMSKCARKIISDYFDTGVVPSEEATCDGVRDPWKFE